MKNLYLIATLTLLVCQQSFSQIEQVSVKFNQLEALVNNDGNLFHNQDNQTAGLKHTLDNAATVYASNLWLAGLKPNGQLVTSAGTFNFGNESDFFPNNINSDPRENLKNYAVVSQDDINEHLNNVGSTGYEVPQNIKDWPANRKDANGNNYTVAPFFDANNNGVYEPELGDFPEIIGTTMLFMIVNDASQQGTVTSDEGLGVDIYISLYAWDNGLNNAIDNSIFVNYKIINRSSNSYTLYKGLFMDTDLGNSSDDYIGSNEDLSTFYTYNGDNNDDINGGPAPGFGLNPPVFGGKVLCGSLTGLMSYRIGGGPTGDVQTTSDYYNYLNSIWKDNTPLMDKGSGHLSGGTPTKYAYSGNPITGTGWTEISAGNPPNDRRLLAAFNEEGAFAPGAEQSFTIALNYARDKTKNAVENIETLNSNFVEVENFLASNSETFPEYWKDNFCATAVGINDNKTVKEVLSIYPNPANTTLNIVSKKDVETVTILSLDGKTLISTNTKNVDVRALETGIYIVQANFKGGGSAVSKFEKL